MADDPQRAIIEALLQGQQPPVPSGGALPMGGGVDMNAVARTFINPSTVPQANPFPESVSSYDPSMRDRLAGFMMGGAPSPLRRQMVGRLVGSEGAGTQGVAPVDFIPGVGTALGANEAYREGDYQGMTLAAAPGGVAAKRAKAAMPMAAAVPTMAAPPPSVLPPGGGAMPMTGAKFPQYAEVYPPVGPPQLMSKDVKDKKHKSRPLDLTGAAADEAVANKTAYWGKVLTPEAEVFQKERNAIRKDMEAQGYPRYFDPAKREHVDPAGYPTPHDMTRDALPKEQKTIDKYTTKYETPETLARLQKGYDVGVEMPNTKDWYAMKQLENEFIKEYGETQGRSEFRRKFAEGMAATTGGADPTSNLMMAQYANYAKHHGLPAIPSHQLPFPIGGQYAGGNINMYRKTAGDPAWQGFDAANPKRHDFSYAFMGHPNKFTFDEQMSGTLTKAGNLPKPEGDSYGVAAGIGHKAAAANNINPRDFQDVAWAGLKKMKTEAKGKKFSYEGPMIEHVNAAVERTHRLTGMPRDEIVRRGLVRSEIPIYGAAGAAVAPGLLQGQGMPMTGPVLEDQVQYY